MSVDSVYAIYTIAHCCRKAGAITLVLFPVGKNVADSRRVGKAVNILEVLLGDGEWLGRDVGNVLANKLRGSMVVLLIFLSKKLLNGLTPDRRKVE